MKKISISLFVLLTIQFLVADIGMEFQITQGNSQVKFAGESSIINTQSNIYAVYCKKDGDMGILELGIANGYGSPFTRYEIDTLYTEVPDNIDDILPVI